jgi:hypothetical protein
VRRVGGHVVNLVVVVVVVVVVEVVAVVPLACVVAPIALRAVFPLHFCWPKSNIPTSKLTPGPPTWCPWSWLWSMYCICANVCGRGGAVVKVRTPIALLVVAAMLILQVAQERGDDKVGRNVGRHGGRVQDVASGRDGGCGTDGGRGWMRFACRCDRAGGRVINLVVVMVVVEVVEMVVVALVVVVVAVPMT